MIRPSLVLEFGSPTDGREVNMDGTSYQAAVQREMIDMARKCGGLSAELKIARATLHSLQVSTDPKWVMKQIAEVVRRIDRTLEEADVRRSVGGGT